MEGLTPIFRSPEAAALAAQGLQASETAARQGIAHLQADAARREHQVQAGAASDKALEVGARALPQDEDQRRRRREKAGQAQPSYAEAPQPRHRLDITA